MNRRLIFCFLFSLFFFAEAQQTSRLWKDLTPGRYAVGFDVMYRYDYSRAWRYNSGKSQSGVESARPIRISNWYPAVPEKKKDPLRFIDYVFLKTEQPDFQELNQILEMRNLNSLKDVLKTERDLANLMDTPMAAVSKAQPAEGKFPVVAYSPGLNETWQHANAVLSEYLASHGFIVIAVPQLGPSPDRLNLRNNQIDLELQVRDIEFALGVIRDFANANVDQRVVMGHSIGGLVSLVLQMRNPTIDAVITLDSPYGWKDSKQWLTSSPYYQPRLMRVPLLDLRRQDDRFDPSVIQSFQYSNRYLGVLPEIAHSDFTSFPMIASNFPTNIMGRTPKAAVAGYQAVCRSILAFLQALMNKESDALKFLSSNSNPQVIKIEHLEGKEPPPLEEVFVRIVKEKGYEPAEKLLLTWKKNYPDEEIINESLMTSIGYDLLSQKEFDVAISVLRLIVQEHPLSANAQDSVAEAYSLSGNKQEAIESYKKVLEVIDKDPKATPELKNSLRQNAQAKLKELSSPGDL